MKKRQEVLDFGRTFPDVYIDTPFRDTNWVLLRYKKNKKAFAWTYERYGNIWVNVKVGPERRDFWRSVYKSVLPGYHQNKEHWNSIILDGSIPEDEIKQMIAESYQLITGRIRRRNKKCNY
ncbi:MAG: MmcQ/YjbR family DNA-binding protein [Clostridiales bacterium]|nr:MmcQ/YjbR family DNA-binding protein [Clostridiales bacterium]